MATSNKTLVTHSGTFHADDIFACAALQLFLDRQGIAYSVIRTRDEAVLATGDYVFDVGGIYDHARGRYDHHQTGGAGERMNGVPYSAFGLVWKHYGSQLCDDETDALHIDEKFVQFLDATDSGYSMYESKFKDTVIPEIDTVFGYFRTTWAEDRALLDTRFLELVSFARQIIERLIIRARDARLALDSIQEAYVKSEDKRILLLDQYWPWHDFVAVHDDILFVVYPSDGAWHAHTTDKEHFVAKQPFPQEWGGLRDTELQAMTGVSDAIFSHTKQFLVVAQSRKGVMDLVAKVLDK